MQELQIKRIHVLDSLRGIAALVVCFHHFFSLNSSFFQKNLSKNTFDIFAFVSNQNLISVLFFFVLSGFSIGISLRNRNLDNSLVINEYLYKRLKRILPIYWSALLLSLLVGIVIDKVGTDDYSFYNLCGNLLFLQTAATAKNWFVPYGQNGPLWSISYEMFFYLIFPSIFIINKNRNFKIGTSYKFIIMLFLVFIGLVINKKLFIPFVVYFNFFIIWIMGFLCSKTFLFGRKYFQVFSFSLLLSLAFILIGKHFIQSDTFLTIAQGMVLASVFYFAIELFKIFPNFILLKPVEKVLNFLFFRIGKGSYAIYALHFPFLLILHYYNASVIFQIFSFIIIVIICMKVEDFSLKFKCAFLKRNYISAELLHLVVKQ